MKTTRRKQPGVAAGPPRPAQRIKSRRRSKSLPGVTELEQYLERYAPCLGQQSNDTLKPLHVPGRDKPYTLDLKRPLFDAQAHVVTATSKTLDHQDSVLLVAECGTGKTIMGFSSAHAHARGKPYTGLVMCPGQLVQKWEREIRETLPDVEVHVIRTFRDLLRLRHQGRPSKPTWWIVTRDRAKLGAKRRAAYNKRRRDGMPICPRCAAPIVDDKTGIPISHRRLSKRKHFCRVERTCVDGTAPKDRCGKPRTCGEPLWAYTHKLDRWEPAKFIHKHLSGFFDYLVADEIHQEKGAKTAQANAFGSLAAACRKVIALTGTLIGGYADHIRPLLFRMAPSTLVREGLGWSDHVAFNERYGRIETRIFEKEKGTDSGDDNEQSRGSKTKSVKFVRPGIMPSLFGRHLLDKCIFLSLDEMAEHLPPLVEDVIAVELDDEQRAAYTEVASDLADAMKVMVRRGSKRLLGKMLATLLGFPDHPHGYGEIGYRDASGDFHYVTTCPDLDREKIRPKEEALLKLVAKEKAEGRQCWVYVELTKKRDVLARLEKLLTAAGHRVKVMRAGVPLEKREAWIAKHGRDADVVLSHPQLVETGMDLFCTHGGHNFCTLIFYEFRYNLFTLWQASRRSWRIGQWKECRVFYMYYAATMQDRALSVMGQKLAAARALDGKFSSEGMAALAGEESSVEMQLAESLSSRLRVEDAQRVWGKVRMEYRPMAPGVPSGAGTDGAGALGEFTRADVAEAVEPNGQIARPDARHSVPSRPRLLWDDDECDDAAPGVASPTRTTSRRTLSLFD